MSKCHIVGNHMSWLIICTNGLFLLVWYNKLEMVHCMYRGVTGYIFSKNIVFLFLKIDFAFANSVDPDECHISSGYFTVCQSTQLGVTSEQRI